MSNKDTDSLKDLATCVATSDLVVSGTIIGDVGEYEISTYIDSVVIEDDQGLEVVVVARDSLEKVYDEINVEVYSVEGVEFKLIQLPEKNIAMAQTQVTQELWEAVMGSNPSHFKGANHPVESVSWEDSVKFANALSLALGLTPAFEGSDNDARLAWSSNGFRLPFEAEWEYAAKANTVFKYSGSDNIDEVAWYNETTNYEGTCPVGTKKPNAWGLYDMSGNVWEWCLTDPNNPGQYYPGTDQRVTCGGSWGNIDQNCTLANRLLLPPDEGYGNLGLRLVRSLS